MADTALVVLVVATLAASVAGVLARCRSCRGPSGCEVTLSEAENREPSILRRLRRMVTPMQLHPVAPPPSPIDL